MSENSDQRGASVDGHMPGTDFDKAKVEMFYGKHSRTKFIRNFVRGNRRIHSQKWFLERAFPRGAGRVLVVGCASGEVCRWLARTVARKASILGVDISADYIEIAGRLFPHKRVTYAVANVLESLPPGPWDVVVFPDVYEHLPAGSRAKLYENIKATAGPNATLLITAPSPAHQRLLIKRGWGLQPVDELVGLADYRELADALGMEVTCFLSASVFRRLDYNYVVIEPVGEVCPELGSEDKLPIRSWPLNPRREKALRILGSIVAPKRARLAIREWRLASRLSPARPLHLSWRVAAAVLLLMVVGLGGFSAIRNQRSTDRAAIITAYNDSRGSGDATLVLLGRPWLSADPGFGTLTLAFGDVEDIVVHLLDKNEDYYVIDEEDAARLSRIDSRNRLELVAGCGDYQLYREIEPTVRTLSAKTRPPLEESL